MKTVVSITILDGNIELAEELINRAKQKFSNAEVRLLSAPKGLKYSVESPMVEIRSGSNYRRAYGKNGLSLLQELSIQEA